MLTTSIVTTFKQTIIIRFLDYWNCILSNLSPNSYFTPSLQSSLNRAVTMIPFEMQARTAQNPEFFFFFPFHSKKKPKDLQQPTRILSYSLPYSLISSHTGHMVFVEHTLESWLTIPSDWNVLFPVVKWSNTLIFSSSLLTSLLKIAFSTI